MIVCKIVGIIALIVLIVVSGNKFMNRSKDKF